MEQEFNFNQLKMDLYGDRSYVTQKWISNYGKLSVYADYDAYISCIKEAFNTVEIVMGNTIYNFRNRIPYREKVSLGNRNGRPRYGYYYQGSDEMIDYGMAATFFGKIKILKSLRFRMPEDLDDVRVLRNMTTHNTHTMVGTVADQVLSYENVLRNMEILGKTLHVLGLLRAEDILPEYEKMRVNPGDFVGYSGEYQVGDFIAEGGMSRVYMGLHTRLNRPVAIKELKPYTYSREQIQNEKQFLVSLENNQIPQIFDIFNQNGTYYIIMEYIDGSGLNQYVKENKPDLNERLAIAIQVCRVLRYIHNECNMVYSDLKPDNIMIERTGRVCLIDFGISQLEEGDVKAGAFSMFYSSPEQMAGKEIDKRSDIYSLGSLLQFLFGYNNDQGGISYLEELGDYREEMQNLCEICKRQDPEARFPNVEEVEGHLRRISDEITHQPRAKKRIIRRTVLISLTVLVALVISWAAAYYFIVFPDGKITTFSEEVRFTEAGIVVRFSVVNRSSGEALDPQSDIYVRMNLGLPYRSDTDKEKKLNCTVTLHGTLNRDLSPGGILMGQELTVSWEDLRDLVQNQIDKDRMGITIQTPNQSNTAIMPIQDSDTNVIVSVNQAQ